MNKWNKKLILIGLLIFSTIILFAADYRDIPFTKKYGIVIQRAISLRDKPSSHGKVVTILFYGNQVKVITYIDPRSPDRRPKDHQWVKIETQFGDMGYVLSESLILLDRYQMQSWQNDFKQQKVISWLCPMAMKDANAIGLQVPENLSLYWFSTIHVEDVLLHDFLFRELSLKDRYLLAMIKKKDALEVLNPIVIDRIKGNALQQMKIDQFSQRIKAVLPVLNNQRLPTFENRPLVNDFDFIRQAYSLAGIELRLPRDIIASSGEKVNDYKSAWVGDILFFRYKSDQKEHLQLKQKMQMAMFVDHQSIVYINEQNILLVSHSNAGSFKKDCIPLYIKRIIQIQD